MLAAAPPLPTAIAFRDPAHGVLGTARSVEVTGDGGKTWRVVFRTPRPVVSISYDDDGRVRVILDDGENIGGPRFRPEHPLELLSPCPAGVNASVKSGDWFLCIGQGSAGSGEKAVYRVTAAGPKRLAWAWLGNPPSSRGLSPQGYAVGIAMAPDGFGLIWESRGPLLVTRNGGSRWLALPRVGVPEVDFGISGAALPHGLGWVILARGNVHRRLLVTRDAGRTWRVVHRWN